jgi:hypothetical protein
MADFAKRNNHFGALKQVSRGNYETSQKRRNHFARMDAYVGKCPCLTPPE